MGDVSQKNKNKKNIDWKTKFTSQKIHRMKCFNQETEKKIKKEIVT